MAAAPPLPQFSTLAAFDHQPRTRIVFGVDSLERLGELARDLSARNVLLVTDAGIVAAGHAERALRCLEAARLKVVLFDRAAENPTTRCVEECVDAAKAAARIAILDPKLTLSQPARVTACTGIDAIAHVVETAVTKRRNALSLMCAHEGFKLTVPNLPRVFHDPQDLEARGRMQLGAAFAGLAIENSMLGAAHSAANPLTAHYGIVHGQAVGMMLPHVVRFNGRDPGALKAYAELASAPEIACVSDGLEEALEALIAHLESLLNIAAMPRSLAACGVQPALVPTLAAEAARQWTASFNPRRLAAEDFERLYEAAFEPRGGTEGPF